MSDRPASLLLGRSGPDTLAAPPPAAGRGIVSGACLGGRVPSDERFGLERVVLRLRYRPGIEGRPGLGDLVAGRRVAGDLPDVCVLRGLPRLCMLCRPLS